MVTPNPPNLIHSELMIVDVKEADHMLVNGGLCQSDIALSAETQPKGKIVFILSARSIRLQGSPILVSHARKTLEDALRRLKRGIEGYAVQIHSLSRNYGHQFGRKFMNNQTTLGSKKLFPVSPPQDKMYIQTWRKHILPQLPDILTPLGDDYSASLVRYGVEETQTNVYIRIRSSNIYKNTQNSISKEVHKLWTSHSAEPIAMLFIKGVLSLIAGISDQCVQDEENQAEGNLPHHQRYQKYASMSSSLGLRCNGTVSGTLGGYVLVDNKMHILTTDHFIEDALREAGESSGGDNTKHQITSPSLFDIETLREDFRASIVSCGIGIAEELEKTHQNEFTPAQAEQADVDSSWWDLVRRWQNDLNQPEEHFVIGKVTDRRARPFIRIDCGGVIADRTMDWALCSVVPGRTGQNRHRHKEQPPYTPLVLEDEGRNPFGTGELCLETVQPGERTAIHYVGAGTGFQSGFVNPAETLVNKRGRKTNEFSITLTSSPQIAHNGDSGAWIIQTEGNKAVGMLWGEEVDLLHFTPLKDIFDNIREQLRVEVCLPGRPYHPPSEAYRKGISRTGQRQSKPRIFQPPARVPPWKGPLKKNLDPLVEAPNPNRSLTQKGPIPSISEASTGNSNSAWRLSREDPIPECLMPSAKTPNPGLLRPGRATGGKQNSAGGDGGSSRLPSLMSDMSISDSTSENPANPPLIGFPVEPLSSPCDTPKKCSIPFLIESFKVGEAENGALASSPQAYPQEVTMPDTNYGITLVANS